jgi:hypothetical protein
MENNRFDAIARLLGSAASRRGIAHLLTGGALIGAARGVEAKKRHKKHRKKDRTKDQCPSGSERCGSACCAEDQLCAEGQCVTGQGTCGAGADSCSATEIHCNGTTMCACFVTTQGDTRCGDTNILSQCGECTDDADCASYGPGAFCARDTGDFCGCDFGQAFCRTPCPS